MGVFLNASRSSNGMRRNRWAGRECQNLEWAKGEPRNMQASNMEYLI